MKIENGTYSAKIRKAFVTHIGNNNTEAVVVEFDLEGGQMIAWNGWMTPKAYERTLETLSKMGFDESIPPVKIEGFACYTEAHFSEKEFSLVIEQEPDIKDPSKSWPRVKWVNLPVESKFKSAPVKGALSLPPTFKEDMAAARAKLGIQKKTPTSQKPESDPLPF